MNWRAQTELESNEGTLFYYSVPCQVLGLLDRKRHHRGNIPVAAFTMPRQHSNWDMHVKREKGMHHLERAPILTPHLESDFGRALVSEWQATATRCVRASLSMRCSCCARCRMLGEMGPNETLVPLKQETPKACCLIIG